MTAPVRYSDRDIARVRELNPIAHVAQDLGHELELRGEGEFVIPCLDSLALETRTAFSMSLAPARGMFYCHHCGSGGDVIAFVEKELKLTFAPAMEYLAQRAGITLEAAP